MLKMVVFFLNNDFKPFTFATSFHLTLPFRKESLKQKELRNIYIDHLICGERGTISLNRYPPRVIDFSFIITVEKII